METTTMLILGLIIFWIPVGFLFASIRTLYWRSVLIKRKEAVYYDFIKTPLSVYLPVCLLWPGQAFSWFMDSDSALGDLTSYHKAEKIKLMPVVPISFIVEDSGLVDKTRLNEAVINGMETYLCCPGKDETNVKKTLIFYFSLGVSFGWLNLIFWLTGIILWLVIFLIYVFYSLCLQISKVYYSINKPILKEK
jgi:hypothetical protein